MAATRMSKAAPMRQAQTGLGRKERRRERREKVGKMEKSRISSPGRNDWLRLSAQVPGRGFAERTDVTGALPGVKARKMAGPPAGPPQKFGPKRWNRRLAGLGVKPARRRFHRKCQVPAPARRWGSRKNVGHHFAEHIREAIVPALELVRQFLVVETEQVQDRRLQVVNVDRV